MTLFAILEAAGLRPLSTNVSRPGSLMGNASDEGALGVLCFAPLFASAVKCRGVAVSAGAAAAALTTVLSASRGALVALVAEVVIIAVVLGGRRVIAVCAASMVLLTGLTFAVPATRHRVLGNSALAHHTVTGRELLWRETLTLDASHLPLGVGPSNYKTAIVREHNREWQQKVGPQNPPDSPHSLPLQALSAGGVPLLLVLLALSGLVLWTGGREAWRERGKTPPFEVGVLVALIGYGLCSMVGITSPGPTVLASVFLGISLSARTTVAPRRQIGELVIGSALLAITAVFLLAAIAEIPLRHAILQVSQGNAAEAASDFAAARVLRPWDLDLPDLAAHAFITYGINARDAASISEGAKWLDRVPSTIGRDEQVELDRASLAEAHGDFAAAERRLTMLLAHDQDNPAILLQRGIVRAESGDTAGAETDFLFTTAVVPRDPGPWQNLATVYRTEGRIDDARRASAHARELAQSP
ncbi:MAG TPA: O-antigen ligase family protein [Mycobacteriales bacterium]|nr:O-antigen ligase family protein [Mycobacteriales bacterium]